MKKTIKRDNKGKDAYCCICKKLICLDKYAEYAYRTKTKSGKTGYACSWTCYRKAEKKNKK